ncbi:MAG TPA: RNase adapter RapZ [Clostridiales bacterium]|nr:RNase adapter RapZ [Clostridiales bacterium]
MEFVIVTGRSGAGKSKAVEILEDIGFVCIDNMPPQLLPSFGQIFLKSEQDFRTAVCVDVRAGKEFATLYSAMDALKAEGIHYKILYLDCDDDTLLRRFKETRRRHPLHHENTLEEAFAAEEKMMKPLKNMADFVIDTSQMKPAQLKARIAGLFDGNIQNTLQVTCMSFGFKYGIPADADLVFDVRCLPNPFYIPELKNHTGLDRDVFEYVMSQESAKDFFAKMKDLISYSLPLYAAEGKGSLVICFGCTGGKHRSVTFAEAMYRYLKEQKVPVNCFHRDVVKQ